MHPATSLPVLLYHHVGDPAGHVYPQLTVTPDAFARHLRWMRARGYGAITLAQCAAWLSGHAVLPAKPVLLTFDDGFEETARHAFPMLRESGYPATVFVVTGQIGGTQVWDSSGSGTARRLMTREQIDYWSSHGIDIGSHSRTHAELTSLDARSSAHEIAGSGADLASLGLVPHSFAYPFGRYDERIAGEVRRHYQLAFTCDEGLNSANQDRSLLRRTMVQPDDTLLDIEARLRVGYSPLRRMKTGLRLRSHFARMTRVWRRGAR